MAKRMSVAEAKALFYLVLIGLPFYLVYKFGESIGWPQFLIGLAVIVVGYFLYRYASDEARQAQRHREAELRRAELIKKYGDNKIVDAIMNRSYWQGQTTEQLIDSLGQPLDIDEKVLKNKKREVWKYHPTGANRFGLRITLENGSVVGWDEKL